MHTVCVCGMSGVRCVALFATSGTLRTATTCNGCRREDGAQRGTLHSTGQTDNRQLLCRTPVRFASPRHRLQSMAQPVLLTMNSVTTPAERTEGHHHSTAINDGKAVRLEGGLVRKTGRLFRQHHPLLLRLRLPCPHRL